MARRTSGATLTRDRSSQRGSRRSPSKGVGVGLSTKSGTADERAERRASEGCVKMPITRSRAAISWSFCRSRAIAAGECMSSKEPNKATMSTACAAVCKIGTATACIECDPESQIERISRYVTAQSRVVSPATCISARDQCHRRTHERLVQLPA